MQIPMVPTRSGVRTRGYFRPTRAAEGEKRDYQKKFVSKKCHNKMSQQKGKKKKRKGKKRREEILLPKGTAGAATNPAANLQGT